jgi:plastocyanin
MVIYYLFKLFLLSFFVAISLLLPKNTLAHSTNSGYTIHVTDEAFEPSELEINQGDTVIFENVGNNNHWPASNIHPTHGIYPEFDSQRPINPQDSWSFTFEKSGTFKMHDHIYATLTGSIKVNPQESENQAEKQIIAKEEKPGIIEKIKSWFRNIYFKLFPKKIDNSLEKIDIMKLANNEERLAYYLKLAGTKKVTEKLLKDSGGGSTIDCHQEAHNIGSSAYKIYKEKAFQEGDPACHSGIYHGAMEAFLLENGTQNLSEKIDSICNSFPTSFGVFECLHGVGHGTLAYLNYDLPEALTVCQSLKDSFSHSSCYGGVFMENILTAQGLGAREDEHNTTWIDKEDPNFPCSGIDQDPIVQFQCYQMQTSWMLTLYKYDFDKVVEQCQNVPKEHVSVCFKSLGRDISGYSLRDPEKILTLCSKVPKTNNYFNQCMEGALNVIVDFWGHNLKDQASNLCKILEDSEKDRCYQILAGRLTGLFSNYAERQAVCKTFEREFQGLCS